jgi:hypothetical protein
LTESTFAILQASTFSCGLCQSNPKMRRSTLSNAAAMVTTTASNSKCFLRISIK